MRDLTELLRKIESLPAATFKAGASMKDRAQEFSLVDRALPLLTPSPEIRVSRSCERSDRHLSFHYQIRSSGDFCDVRVRYEKDTRLITMTVYGEQVDAPETVEDLALILKEIIEGKRQRRKRPAV